jgi:hypothetical protein
MVKYDRATMSTRQSVELEKRLGHENHHEEADGPTNEPPVEPHIGNNLKLVRRTYSQRSLGSHKSFGRSRSGEEHRSDAGAENGDRVSSLTSPEPSSPHLIHSVTSTIYNGSSFDLDDDENDTEMDVHRYDVDFSATETGHALSKNGSSTTMNSGFSHKNRSSLFRCLWYSFQSARQKARERRAELLLRQKDHSCRQSSWRFCVTLCDATDGGILLVAGLMVAWIIAVVFTKNPVLRRRILICGMIFFVIRLGTRPMVEFLLRQRMKRRQRQAIAQHSPTFRREPPSGMETPGTKTQMSLYLDRTMNDFKTQSGGIELSVMQSNSTNNNNNGNSLPGLQPSNSNGSDPTIAAI